MAALSWLMVEVAHGGVYGAFVEGGVALAILGLFLWVWLRERRRARPAPMRDDED